MITVYYSERIQIKISKRKRHTGEIPEKPSTIFQVSSPNGVTRTHIILSAMMCDNTCKVLSSSEAHPSLGVQDFYWESAMWAGHICATDLSYSDPMYPRAKQMSFVNHSQHKVSDQIGGPRYQVYKSTLTGRIFQELRVYLPRASQGLGPRQSFVGNVKVLSHPSQLS